MSKHASALLRDIPAGRPTVISLQHAYPTELPQGQGAQTLQWKAKAASSPPRATTIDTPAGAKASTPPPSAGVKCAHPPRPPLQTCALRDAAAQGFDGI